MPTYLSPGVYVEEVEAGSRPIEGVGTAVAAFIGLAERGPVNEPVLVTAPHAGFCPDGPHSGRALVVERDAFDTKYGSPTEFTTNQTLTFDPVPEDPAG